jgi:hypothetical protein
MSETAGALQLEISTCSRCGLESLLGNDSCARCEAKAGARREAPADASSADDVAETPRRRRRTMPLPAQRATPPGGFRGPPLPAPKTGVRSSSPALPEATPTGKTLPQFVAVATAPGSNEDERRSTSAQASDAARGELADLVTELRAAHAAYEKVNAQWSPDVGARKKQLRQARADVLVRITALLERMDRSECGSRIQRLCFEQKIQELDEIARDGR